MFNSIKRDKKRRFLVKTYELKRLEYKFLINTLKNKKEKYKYIYKLNNLPKNSSKVRIRNRCVVSGRSRSVYSFCKLSRIALRELANQGLIPGMIKSSW